MKLKLVTAALLLTASTVMAGNWKDPKITEVSLDSLRAQRTAQNMSDEEYFKQLKSLKGTVDKNLSEIDKSMDEVKSAQSDVKSQQKLLKQQRNTLKVEEKNIKEKNKVLKQETKNIEKEEKDLKKNNLLSNEEKQQKTKSLKERTSKNEKDLDATQKRSNDIQKEYKSVDKKEADYTTMATDASNRAAELQALYNKWKLQSDTIKQEISLVKNTIKTNKKLQRK